MWDEVPLDIGEARNYELYNNLFKMAIYKGARMVRHHNTVESAHDIIRMLAASRPVVLQIQRELVDEGKRIIDTAAGEAVNREPDWQTRQHQAELKRLREEMVQLREKEEETRLEREEERKKLQEWMEAMEQGVKERERAEAEHKRQLTDLNLRLQGAASRARLEQETDKPQDHATTGVAMPPRRPTPYVQVLSRDFGCDKVTKYPRSSLPPWERASLSEHRSLPTSPARIACVFEPTILLKWQPNLHHRVMGATGSGKTTVSGTAYQ